VPSNIPVSGFGGKSLFGLFMGSIGSNLVRASATRVSQHLRYSLPSLLLPLWRCAWPPRCAQPLMLAVKHRARRCMRRIGAPAAAWTRARASPQPYRRLVPPCGRRPPRSPSRGRQPRT
jgi:hypothetical protein